MASDVASPDVGFAKAQVLISIKDDLAPLAGEYRKVLLISGQ